MKHMRRYKLDHKPDAQEVNRLLAEYVSQIHDAINPEGYQVDQSKVHYRVILDGKKAIVEFTYNE